MTVHTNRALLAVSVLAVALGIWVVLSAGRADVSPRDMLAMLGLLVGAYALGVLVHRWVVPVAFVGLAVMVYVLYVSQRPFSGAPLADPLNYANANGALYVQVAALSGLAAASTRQPGIVAPLVLATGAVASLPFVVGSAAAAAGAVIVVGATLLALTPLAGPLVKVAAALGIAAIMVTGAATALVAEHYGNGSPTDFCTRCPAGTTAIGPKPKIVAGLSERRIELWRDAERLGRVHPVFGVGPGRFRIVSPISRYDKDTRAAHSQLLEQAAETGLVGGLLLLGLALAVLLGITAASSKAGLVAVAAWTAFCLHTEVDYVADFVWVVVPAGLVAGLGSSGQHGSPSRG